MHYDIEEIKYETRFKKFKVHDMKIYGCSWH